MVTWVFIGLILCVSLLIGTGRSGGGTGSMCIVDCIRESI